MGKFKIDSSYEKETKAYMKDVINKLADSDGEINNEWFAGLIMLAENYNTFIQAKKIINKEGLQIKNRFGDYISHPLNKIAENANIQCLKLLNEFGLTKKSAAKIDEIKTDKKEENLLYNFIKGKKESR